MTRSNRTSTAVPVLRERGKGLPRELTFRLTDGSAALVRDRLDTFAAAFLADDRPGLLFEYGRLVAANDSARSLFGSTAISESFLEALKASVGNGVMERGLLLLTGSEIYAPVLHPPLIRRGHPTCVCFLVKTSEPSAAYARLLTGRELDVLRILVKGLSNRQIAEQLGVSTESVRKHISRALRKTGAKTRAGLVGRFFES